ncbi:phosphotransferase [Arthrobacter sp. PsM3]|uniref:phosphotransferase n=1 Tax=Arthrobacter sp. PsM3 TaxID=3030531 RepID=UPI00263A6789|nr:phosphotransferase [Arthrobacter sp. PsM3]MDN4642483.1 phosphotransferase [Arthrobacter sp. PsM3]
MAVDLMNMDILAGADPGSAILAGIAAACLAEPDAELLSASAEELGPPAFNMTTGGLWRVCGTARTGCGGPRGTVGTATFSTVVKVIQSPLLWPAIGQVPESQRAELAAKFPWETEAQVYASGLSSVLPAGGRMPEIYRLDAFDAQRTAIWMEDVPEAPPTAWTEQRFVDAARFLGRLAGSPEVRDRGPAGGAVRGHEGLRFYLDSVAASVLIPGILGEDLWSHPAVAAAADPALIAGLRRLTARADGLLDDICRLPSLPAHGDASPQNLLIRPGTGSGVAPGSDFTVIDWGFYGFACPGFDLGQLLAGWVNQGQMRGAELYALEPLCLAAYCEGLADFDAGISETDVRRGHAASMAVFTGLAAVATQRLAEPDSEELRALVSGRLEMARFILDLLASTD